MLNTKTFIVSHTKKHHEMTMFTTAADHHRFCTLHNTSRLRPFHSPLPNNKPVHPRKISAFDNVPGQSDIVRLFPPEMVVHTVELTANRTGVE